ncbi:CHAT domain-containing protein [Cronbergia sp. UHCC 0137]|uniref:CHAT domain-containing protein n=1 Tax=Cronbergia sp. UHCC 0137 TaxID=3110239 RepID=UPI002B2064B3|nr:CHAT domain-containing protein [Cronbergia sp. UHCC 0137]MEA5616424.1 CHAT domain-containing protein [Cronbergia sp. UHCC 0137]
MTQEFHLSVTLVGQNDYLVRTEHVAPGVPLAEELVTWPVDEWLGAAGNLMNDPLQLLLQGEMLEQPTAGMTRNAVNLVALGQKLYNALFQGTLRDSWITAQGIAQNHQQVLRLRLGLKDTKLAKLPWEVMHAGDRPLATGPYIAFSRYQTGILTGMRLPVHNMPTPQEDSVVKVLMIISSPTDLVRLDLLKQEAIKLQAELHRQPSKLAEGSNHLPEIEFTLLDQPGREELTQTLEQGRFHILHYSGHSNLGANGGEIYLVSHKTGLTETLSGDDLAGLLLNNNIQMAVFNSCLGAYRARPHPDGETGEGNLTESLVKRGIRSVLAMSERIPDEVALTLTQLFYRNLSQGYPLDLCVSRVRQGLISAYGSQQMYWALPTLYLHREFDGFLTPEIPVSPTVEFANEYQPSARVNTAIYSSMADEAEISLNMLEEDDAEIGWLGEDAWEDMSDGNSGYDDDAALVSDLFRELGQPLATTENTSMMAELLPQVQENQILETELTVQEQVPTIPNTSNLPVHPIPTVRKISQLWPILAVVAATTFVAIAIIIGRNWQYNSSVTDIPPIPNSKLSQSQIEPIDLEISKIELVTAYATEQLSQGNIEKGLEAVEKLLDRSAFKEAETALSLISAKEVKNPAVNFLRGRLAWQLARTGNQKYSVDDARRYWEVAVREKPNSILYNSALGFAHYAEGNLNRANHAWLKAVGLALKKAENTNSQNQESVSTSIPAEALNSYAGIALGLYKSAKSQSGSKGVQYLNKAINLRQMVIREEPIKFTVNKLPQNWLWTESAIADWRNLLQEKADGV